MRIKAAVRVRHWLVAVSEGLLVVLPSALWDAASGVSLDAPRARPPLIGRQNDQTVVRSQGVRR